MKSTWKLKYYLAGAIALATFVVYLPALHNGFVDWDDGPYLYENFHIRSFNLSFFKWAFLNFSVSNWHPLTWISHALDYALWGPDPFGHHLTSILLHAANSFLAVVLVIRLLDVYQERAVPKGSTLLLNARTKLMAGGIAGLLFGLHPVHVESVAWVSERKDLLCALFFLLSMIMYMSYASNKTYRKYLLTLAFFVLALLSKPMAITLPIVLLILDWHPFGRISSIKTFQAVLVEKLPFFALCLVSAILTVLAQRAALSSIEAVPLSIRALVGAKALVSYLWKMIYPLNLVPFYRYPKQSDVSLIFYAEYLSALALVIGITVVFIVVSKRQKKVWLAAWGYYVATLIPVLGIVQVGGQSMADRYTYLPSLGPFFMMGLAAAWVFEKVDGLIGWKTTFKAFSAIVAVAAIVSLAQLTLRQSVIWKDSFSLWNYVIAKEPERAHVAYNGRGIAFQKKGRLDEALEDFNKAIAIDPSFVDAFFNRGIAYEKMGRLDKAIEDYNTTIALNPSYYEAYTNRGMIYEKRGQPEKAIEDYQMTIALNPTAHEAYYNLGVLYGKAGLFEQALESFNESLAINPGRAEGYIDRGTVNALMGRREMALQDFNRALHIDQSNASAYFNRGTFYLSTGKRELALADFQKACDLGDEGGCNASHGLVR